MRELIIIALISLILIFGLYLHLIEINYEKNLPISVKFPKYTNYDIAKKKYLNASYT